MIDWSTVRTVLLDMDGTLLDLHFDNHFWQEHVPLRFAQLHKLSIEQAKSELFPRFKNAEGSLDWYCVDYWSQQLGLDIVKLKKEVDHLIAIHPNVPLFLQQIRNAGIRVLLVTNAHVKSLELKMQQTRLAGYFHHIVSSHDLGCAKEHDGFWEKLKSVEMYNKKDTLLIDDSLPVLRCANRYGISHLLAIRKPDTRQPEKDVAEFRAISGFHEILPEGEESAVG